MSSSDSVSPVRVGIIGGGLMGREAASARWFTLVDFPVRAELTAVCDVAPKTLEWFRQVPTVKCLTSDHRELLARNDVDVVYVAVPHHLHESLYLDEMQAGKDLLAEKPSPISCSRCGRPSSRSARACSAIVLAAPPPMKPSPAELWSAALASHRDRSVVAPV